MMSAPKALAATWSWPGILDQGGVKPLLDQQTFSLTEVGKAYERLTSGQAIDKIVVEV